MKSLILEELTVEQKIGQLLFVRGYRNEEDKKFVLQMIKNKSVGGVQVRAREECLAINPEILSVADYPILIANDMECGFPMSEYKLPSPATLGLTRDIELAYQAGAVTAIEAKRHGFNMVWGPIVDLLGGNNMCMVPRVLGYEKEDVAKMATALIKGYTDNGMVCTVKHWGSTVAKGCLDGHMFKPTAPTGNPATTGVSEKTLKDREMYPYLYAMKNADLSGVMTSHAMLRAIDPEYPTTLSEKNISILRNAGFDGLMITDSFGMVGILQKFGVDKCYGLAIKAGNDMILPNFTDDFKTTYNYLLKAYKDGVFTEERLNEAVSRVIKAQNSTLKPATSEYPSEYQKECFKKIEKDGIIAVSPSGTDIKLDTDTKKLFVLVAENVYRNNEGESYEIADVTSICGKNIPMIKESILKRFPGCEIIVINQLPNWQQVMKVCQKALQVENVIFLTFVSSTCYCASENLTEHITNLMLSMKEKIAAIIHLGNPYAAEKIPHSDRYVLCVGGDEHTERSVDHALGILNGEYLPKAKWFENLDLH